MTSTNTQKEKLKGFITKRDKCFTRMQALYDLTKTVTENNLNTFLSRFDKIEDYYSEFDSICEDIEALCNAMAPEDKIDTAGSSKAFDTIYFETKGFVATKGYLIPRRAEPTATVTHPKLPKLEVPVFSGELKDWSNFHALFKSTIHLRTDITEIEKLQYLRSLLRGPPLTLIETLQLVRGNYTIAYELLCGRYENKRALAAHHLNMILNFKPLPLS